MPEVGIRVLRDNLSRYIGRVREGEELVVTDHGKAVARIVPIDRPGLLERLVAEGVVTLPSRQGTYSSPQAYRTPQLRYLP